MKIPIKLKRELDQTVLDYEWKYGHMISTVTMADNVGYAVILTEHNGFDLVPFSNLIAIDTE